MTPKLYSLLLIAAFLLSACAPAATPTQPPAPTAPAMEKPVATEAVAEVAPEADECVACHTDKQRLIDTAKVVEAAESESKGVG